MKGQEKETKKCCICGREFKGWGNNPWPVKKDGECCDMCNFQYVLPERIRLLDARERNELQQEETICENMGF